MADKIRIAILGASGYTGAELLRLLPYHPHVEIVALSGDSQAGKPIADVYPHLSQLDLTLAKMQDIDFSAIDLVFCCLPHATTQPILAGLPPHLRIVDLSADFRLHDPEDYRFWYGHTHQAPEIQSQTVYGLTEWYRETIESTRVVANPGCYPTCSLLPLLPLVQAGLIDTQAITIDALSGVTGAGRKAAQPLLFSEVNDGAKAYGVGGHRHVAEIEQEVGLMAKQAVTASFTAHLVPMSRGMSATIHVALKPDVRLDQLREALHRRYHKEPFVELCAPGVIPTTHEVRGTNRCKIAVMADRRDGHAILVSVIDNLMKGASGQAIQNMNCMYGWPETTGLQLTAIFP